MQNRTTTEWQNTSALAVCAGAVRPSRGKFDDEDLRRLRVAFLLESIIDAMPSKKCRRTIRTLWLNQWDTKGTAKDLGVSEKAIAVALHRFKKAAAKVVTVAEFQEMYESIFS